jgi:hypothetical protein
MQARMEEIQKRLQVLDVESLEVKKELKEVKILHSKYKAE